MSKYTEYKNMYAFHPGWYIEQDIEYLGMTQEEFAHRLGTTPKTVSKLVNGQASITQDLAYKLSSMFGNSYELWINMQSKYDQDMLQIKKEKEFDAQTDILNYLDYSYFSSVGNIEDVKDNKERIKKLCAYLKVSDLRNILAIDYLVSFKSYLSKMDERNIVCSNAWVQTALNFAYEMDVENFNVKKLREALPEIQGMIGTDPEVFLPRLKEIFASCGVCFVVLPHLKYSGVNGAVKWLNNRVLLAVCDSGKYTGRFWFTLFHEIKHVFQQKLKTVFLNPIDKDLELLNDVLEQDADNFANEMIKNH